MTETFTHKRGATFRVTIPVVLEGDGWTLRSDMVFRRGGLVQNFEVQDLTQEYENPVTNYIELTASASDVEMWPLGLHRFDIRAENEAGEVVYTISNYVNVIERDTA